MGLRDFRPTTVVEIDGEVVKVKGLTVGQAEELAELTTEEDKLVTFQRRVVALTTYGDDGLYFRDEEDVKDLHRSVLDKLFAAAADVSGLNDNAVEEAEKN